MHDPYGARRPASALPSYARKALWKRAQSFLETEKSLDAAHASVQNGQTYPKV